MVKAQDWLKNNFTDKNTTDEISLVKTTAGGDTGNVANLTADCDELTGELLIEDYVNAKVINLERHAAAGGAGAPGGLLEGKITKLTIKNCPKLERIDADWNNLTEIKFEGPLPVNLKWLDLRRNDLKEVDIGSFPNLQSLYLMNNSRLGLESIKGLEELVELSYFEVTGINNNKGLDFNPFKTLKNAIKNLLNINLSNDLPSTWQGDLTSKLGGKKLTDIPSGQTLASLIDTIKSIKDELKLGDSANQQQIIYEIRKLRDRGSSANSITKASLASSAKDSLKGLEVSEKEINEKLGAAASAREVEIARNKLVSSRFNELQTRYNYAQYLNIGLATFSALILLVLVWMFLKDRKLLPSQGGEDQKEE